MKVAVIGSSSFPLREGAGYILEAVVLARDRGDDIAVRGRCAPDGTVAPVAGVDHMVSVYCEALHVPCHVIAGPQYGPSRVWSFQRDRALAESSDEIIAFYDPKRIGEGGTAHVIDVALMVSTKVKAFTLDDEGNLIRVGDSE